MRVAHQVTTIGNISSITTSYWVENFIWCIKACTNLNGIELLLKWTGRTLKMIKSFLVLFLKYGRKIPEEKHHV